LTRRSQAATTRTHEGRKREGGRGEEEEERRGERVGDRKWARLRIVESATQELKKKKKVFRLPSLLGEFLVNQPAE
jgi:hypothetical protein